MQKYLINFSKAYGYATMDEEYIPCAICGSTARDLHHIKKRSEGGSDDISNLLPVCRNCHINCEARQFTPEEQLHFLYVWQCSHHYEVWKQSN